jgi:hypothetical protein
MKQWILGRGQTLVSLIIVIGLIWGLISIILKLPPADPANPNISTLSAVLIGVVATLAATAVGLGKSIVEVKKEEEKP